MNDREMDYREVLAYWFGRLPLKPDDMDDRLKLWYGFDSATDTVIRERFGALVEAALAGSCASWEREALSRLALIIVLDQFTRNIYRGRAGAFAGDDRALALALDAIDRGMDREVGLLERAFYYMPLQHAEDLAAQELSVRVTEQLDAECLAAFEDFSGEQASYARDHRDVIARFGRFPHRNTALGRESTEEELAYLAGDAPTYGQSPAEDR
ncbi:MAG: DUF924 domain-containing protein [Gammaproteobacteria bacterium]|nr:DUF924 domain-containing protein [Gammaproteobacteria bacterium]